MDCETNDCRKEKRGCKGCYYDELQEDLIEHEKTSFEFQELYIKTKSELETYKNKIAEIKKWCDAVVDSEYSSKFSIDGKEIITDTGYCLDLAEPILEIINGKEVQDE